MRVPRLVSPRDNELILYNTLKRVTAGLPDQTGNNGKFLTTDGATASWLNLTGGGDMIGANNLSDVVSASTSLTNLGGLAAANNLSDVEDTLTSATNLGLVTDFTVINDTTFPTVKAVESEIDAHVLPYIGTPTYLAASSVNLSANPTFSEAKFSITGRAGDGQVLTISGEFTVDPSSATTLSGFQFEIPISPAITLQNTWSLSGMAICGVAGTTPIQIRANVANQTAEAIFTSGTTVTAQTYSYVIQLTDLT